MAVLRFLWRYVLVAIFAAIGVVFVIFDLVSRVVQVWTWGLPAWTFELAGFLFILLAVVTLVFQLHNRMEALEGRAPTPPAAVWTETPSPPPTNEPQDVIDAKLRLGDYVVKSLTPIEFKLRPVIANAAHYIRDLHSDNPQAQLSWMAVVAMQPQFGGQLRSFETIDKIKATTIPKLELEILDALIQYNKAVDMISKVIELSTKEQSTWTGSAFAREFRLWFPDHQRFIEKSSEVFSDLHFNALRRHTGAVIDRRLVYFDQTA